MLKLILIIGIGLLALAVIIALCVVIFEHIQHRNKQDQYDELHNRMGLGSASPPEHNQDANDS